jgi:hypothetical protein
MIIDSTARGEKSKPRSLDDANDGREPWLQAQKDTITYAVC